MSAWIVSREHIDILVTALDPSTQAEGDRLGRMLWAECLKSVAYRYPHDTDGGRPGPTDFHDADVQTYIWTPREVPAAWIRAAASCYDYQSCEHPGYKTSEARRIAHSLCERYAAYDRHRDYNQPVGPDNPPWGINGSDLAELAALDPGCRHSAMRERAGDARHAWECADCGHVYGNSE